LLARRIPMWSRLRETVAGLAEQAGIEIPGLDAGAAVVSDLAGSAETLVGNIAPEGIATDLAEGVGGLIGSTDPAQPGGGTGT
jgi:hypothetical protein